MKKTIRTGVVAVAAFAAVTAGATSASAAPSGKGGAAKVANPAQACAAVQTTLTQFGALPDDWRFSTCVRTVAGQVPDLPDGSPYEQCAALEQGVQVPGGPFLKVSYPHVFYGEPGGPPFPSLRANNREQCARALWTYHTIVNSFPDGPA